MQFKSLALLALSATGTVAAEEKRQIIPTDAMGKSVFSVLATAIPPDVASLALSNPNQLSSQLASSLSAGQTPSWYQALPSDVKSYLPKLFPASTAATPTPSNTNPVASVVSSVISSVASSVASSVSASVSASVSNALNSTTISSVKSATLSPSGSSASGRASSASSSGGAAYPTAVVGAGVAGALGFLGMLAL